jgi:hypothetical protein
MARKHAFVIAIFLGVAAAIGAIAAIDTARLAGPQATAGSTQSQSAQLQRRSRLLDLQAASLRHALAKRPPQLPKVPVFARAGTSGSSRAPAAAAAPAPRVQFVRPAPVIVVTHRSHEGDDEGEHDEEGGGGDD